MENKIGHTTIAIPATDINDPYDGYEIDDEAAHLVLKVTITTEWDEAGEEIESELHDGETGEPEEDGEKYGN